jgi:uncharacterized membrane protein
MESKTGSGNNPEAGKYHRPRTVEELTKHNVETVRQLEEIAKAQRSRTDRLAGAIAAFCGSMRFVWLHIAWFVIWILVNTLPGIPHFDPFPYTFLTLVVSLEAIFLSTFILISQNYETRISDRRNNLDLQVNLLAEQENTKMLTLLARIAEKVGARVDDDPTIEVLEQATRPETLAEQIEQAMENESEREKADDTP